MSETLERLAANWQGLLDAIDGIPDEALSRPGTCGEWSVKDALAHVAYWDDKDGETIAREAAGGPGQPEDIDFEAINQTVAVERAGWSAADVRRELVEAHARLVAAVAGAPGIDPEVVRASWEHYDEHGAEIRAWRASAGV